MKRNLAEELYRKSRTKGPIQILIIIKMQRNSNQKNKFGIQNEYMEWAMTKWEDTIWMKTSQDFSGRHFKNNVKKKLKNSFVSKIKWIICRENCKFVEKIIFFIIIAIQCCWAFYTLNQANYFWIIFIVANCSFFFYFQWMQSSAKGFRPVDFDHQNRTMIWSQLNWYSEIYSANKMIYIGVVFV